jgi:hypothetical protein
MGNYLGNRKEISGGLNKQVIVIDKFLYSSKQDFKTILNSRLIIDTCQMVLYLHLTVLLLLSSRQYHKETLVRQILPHTVHLHHHHLRMGNDIGPDRLQVNPDNNL